MELGNDLVPKGRYTAHVIETEIVNTKSGEGKIAKFTFEILDGPFERRRIWENYNYINPNAEAQKIARRQMGRLAEAIGLGVYRDTAEFHHKPLLIDVTIEAGKDGYDDKNKVSKFVQVTGAAPPQPANAAPRSQLAGADAGGHPSAAPALEARRCDALAEAHLRRPRALGPAFRSS